MKKIVLPIILLSSLSIAKSPFIYVRLDRISRSELSRIKQIVEYIDNYNPKTGELKAHITNEGFKNLLALGYNPVELVDTSALNAEYYLSFLDNLEYHTYAELRSWAATLATNYPAIVKFDSIGPSVQGRWIWVLRITDNPESDEIEPEFVYISTMHGDEPVGTELLVWFCDSLTQKYGVSSRITNLVNSVDLWVIPLMNPDGRVLGTRYNANLVDLNRNFHVPDGTRGEDNTYTVQTETRAVMDFLDARKTTSAINFHTGAVIANYAWDFDTARSPDWKLYIERALDYSRLNPHMYLNPDPPIDSGIVHGFDWYEVDGSLQDWDYHTGGGLHITIELSSTQWPPASDLPDIWAENYQSFLRAVELARTGLHGVVKDSFTEAPLPAVVWIDKVRRWIETDPAQGDFHKELLAGTYSITVIADGYYPKRIDGIVIPTDTSTSVFVEVYLNRADTIFFSDFEANNGGFYTQGFSPSPQDWQWGIPDTTGSAPWTVPSGIKLWATKLDSFYRNNSKSRLKKDINLAGVTSAVLLFKQFYRYEKVNWALSDTIASDGGNVKVVRGNDTTIISPPWGYAFKASPGNSFMAGDSIFGDDEPGTPWHNVVFFLDNFAGDSITILWDFGSDLGVGARGWYIDDVAILKPSVSHSVEHEKHLVLPNIEIFPNPFNSSCQIIVSSFSTGTNLKIVDVNGKTVARYTLRSGVNRIYWEPEDLPSGIYFVNIAEKQMVLTRKVLLVR